MPVERKERDRVFQTVFGSKAALEILKRTSPNKRIYQKELISGLSFSNKTIIEALKRLVSAGVLEQGMERREEAGKTVWTKWYLPTSQGKWLALLLQSPASLSKVEAREIITELFMMYVGNLIKLCADYDIEPATFESAMNRALLRSLEENKRKVPCKSRVVVYGSAVIDTVAVVGEVPEVGEILYLSDVRGYPGGSAANVSVAIRRLGVPVSFVGKVGGDAGGVLLMKEFKREGVDTSGVIIELEQATGRTFITIDENGGRRALALGGDNVAFSISSPDEVGWSKVEDSEVVYVGEVFTEVAELIASFARSRGKKVVYRPWPPFIEFDREKVRKVLRDVNVLILNQQGREAIKERPNSTPADLIKMGPEVVIVIKGVEGCEVYSRDEVFAMPVYGVEIVDSIVADDAFVAGLVSAFLESRGLRGCIEYALAVSAISATKGGARRKFPTRSEVEEFMKTQRTAS